MGVGMVNAKHNAHSKDDHVAPFLVHSYLSHSQYYSCVSECYPPILTIDDNILAVAQRPEDP